MTKVCDFYFHRQQMIYHNKKLGGWVVEGDFRLYKTKEDARNAVDKSHSSCHKAEPRVIRTMTDSEFIFAFSD